MPEPKRKLTKSNDRQPWKEKSDITMKMMKMKKTCLMQLGWRLTNRLDRYIIYIFSIHGIFMFLHSVSNLGAFVYEGQRYIKFFKWTCKNIQFIVTTISIQDRANGKRRIDGTTMNKANKKPIPTECSSYSPMPTMSSLEIFAKRRCLTRKNSM